MTEGRNSIWRKIRAPFAAAALLVTPACGNPGDLNAEELLSGVSDEGPLRMSREVGTTPGAPAAAPANAPADGVPAETPNSNLESLTCAPVAVSNIPAQFNNQMIRFVVLERETGTSWGNNADCLIRNSQWAGLSTETSAYLTQEARTNFQETDNAAPNGWTVEGTFEARISNGSASFQLPPTDEVGNSFLVCAILPDASWRCVLRMPTQPGVNDQISFN